MQVVLSGCVGCADQNLNPALPDPQQMVPSGAVSRISVSPPRAWQLGGKNLGPSYRQMIAGYRYTRKVTITAMTVRAGAVTVRVLAYETTGAVQTDQLSYLVSGRTIVAKQQTLLRTSG